MSADNFYNWNQHFGKAPVINFTINFALDEEIGALQDAVRRFA